MAKMRLVLFLFCLAWPAFATKYRLFEGREPNAQYRKIVRQLGPGDVVVFSDGVPHTIAKRINAGNLNTIFELTDGRALRIANDLGKFVTPHGAEFDYQESLTEYLLGAKHLKRKGVPVVEVDHAHSLEGEYVLSEKVDVKQDFDNLVKQLSANPEDPELLQDFTQLKEFFRKTALFAEIGDLHAGNLVQRRDGEWIALDFMSGTRPYRGHTITNWKPFEFMAELGDFLPLFYYDGLRKAYETLPANLRADLNDMVEKERDRRIGIGLWHRPSTACFLAFRHFVAKPLDSHLREWNR